MPNTYTLIASSTVGAGGASSISFSSIPATYTDLILKLSGIHATTNNWVNVTFNGVSTNLSGKYLYANPNNAPVSGSIAPLMYTNPTSYTANTPSNGEMYIPNYAGSAAKSMSIDTINENNATPTDMLLMAGLWNSTSAINQITLTPNSGTLAQYTTAYLYGVKNA